MDVSFLKSIGSSFHTVGAAWQKHLSPNVTYLVLKTFKRSLSDDLRFLDGLYSSIRSQRYGGASPFKHLKTSMAILKLILNLTGSQWRCIKQGVV